MPYYSALGGLMSATKMLLFTGQRINMIFDHLNNTINTMSAWEDDSVFLCPYLSKCLFVESKRNMNFS